MPYISVVIPLYCCSETIPELTRRLKHTLEKVSEDYEIIYVNDASPENDWEIVVELSKKDERIKGLNFSRNFGQHSAISAGIDFATGDYIVVMDGDLQDEPEAIPLLHKKIIVSGGHVVFARRIHRKHSFWKRLSSRIFYKLLNYLSGLDFNPQVANFSIISKNVADSFRNMKEINRAYPMFIMWLGYKIYYLDINHMERKYGNSSYSFLKLHRLAETLIIANTNKPLQIGIQFGLIISLISFIIGVYFVTKYFITGIPIVGWTSLFVSLWFIFGVLLSFLGLIGIYIGKIFDETKNRPRYVIMNSTDNIK